MDRQVGSFANSPIKRDAELKAIDRQLRIPCLGRAMTLGSLYDCHRDEPIPAFSLWNYEKLQRNRQFLETQGGAYEVSIGDRNTTKTKVMKMDGNLNLSFLAGLVKVDKLAAEYLSSSRDTTEHERVVLKYSCKTCFESLSMEHLALENIDHPDVFKTTDATHVVIAVEYGADAIFVTDYDTESSDDDEFANVGGSLESSISKYLNSSLNLDALSKFVNEIKKYRQLNSEFFGDCYPRIPKTIEEARQVCNEIPDLIKQTKGANGVYGLPKEVVLYPLCKLNSEAKKLFRVVDLDLASNVESIMEGIETSQLAANDLKRKAGAYFPYIKNQATAFGNFLDQFQIRFKNELTQILPTIRGVEKAMEESLLQKALERMKSSPFGDENLKKWLDQKKKEVDCLDRYVDDLKKSGVVVTDQSENYAEDTKLKYVLCLSLGNTTPMEDRFISAMADFLAGGTAKNWEYEEEKSWYDDQRVKSYLRSQVQLLCDFATANKDNRQLVCLVTTAPENKNSEDKPGIISLYVNGVKETFQIPSQPGQLEAKIVRMKDITITWKVPKNGANFIDHYNISFHPVGSVDNQQVTCENSDTIYCIDNLNADTEYVFKIVAVTKIGESPQSEKSLPIKTLSQNYRPELVEIIKDEQNLLLRGKGDKPSWYRVPATQVTLLDGKTNLRLIEIGKPHQEVAKPMTILLLGEKASGKSSVINGMINYMLGVKWEDKIRLQLVNEDDRGTKYMTIYKIHWRQEINGEQEQSTKTTIIIDTPGVCFEGDMIIDPTFRPQLMALFKKGGIQEIDIISPVVPISDIYARPPDEPDPTNVVIAELALMFRTSDDAKHTLRPCSSQSCYSHQLKNCDCSSCVCSSCFYRQLCDLTGGAVLQWFPIITGYFGNHSQRKVQELVDQFFNPHLIFDRRPATVNEMLFVKSDQELDISYDWQSLWDTTYQNFDEYFKSKPMDIRSVKDVVSVIKKYHIYVECLDIIFAAARSGNWNDRAIKALRFVQQKKDYDKPYRYSDYMTMFLRYSDKCSDMLLNVEAALERKQPRDWESRVRKHRDARRQFWLGKLLLDNNSKSIEDFKKLVDIEVKQWH